MHRHVAQGASTTSELSSKNVFIWVVEMVTRNVYHIFKKVLLSSNSGSFRLLEPRYKDELNQVPALQRGLQSTKTGTQL